MQEYKFPEGFLWGAATASYQIEGAAAEDGKGESIWDRFSHTPGKIMNGDTGDTACDHYHRCLEDVALMAEMGLKAYRFSISWPRLFPAGKGALNRKGLDFYRRLVEALLSKGIQPVITLYHWDLPQALQDKGGWASRDTARYFADYASCLYERLDQAVPYWITLNEPSVVSLIGNFFGVHAPGETDPALALKVSHHLNLAHSLAVQAFRQSGRRDEQIGITFNLTDFQPFSESEADRAAATRMDGLMNRWFLDPVLKGAYPADTWALLESRFEMPQPGSGDLAAAGAPVDFVGINYYTRELIRAIPGDDFFGLQFNPPGAEYTEMGWEIYPAGLYRVLTRVHKEYGPLPLHVTENGAAFTDTADAETGRIDDPRRINYLREHFYQAWRAIRDGVPLQGYFVWTLMDNFEWAYGFAKRFGLVYVDFETKQKRTWKQSAHWYRGVISANAVQR